MTPTTTNVVRSGRRALRSAPVTRKALNLRVRPDVRALIDSGAEVAGKNLTDFVLDAAKEAAQNALLDRTSLSLNSRAFRAFVSLLDAPARPNARLRKALRNPPVWE